MKIQKHFILAALLLAAISVSAQEGSSAIGVQFGFAQTDYRLNSWDPEASPTELTNIPLNGFKVGLVWDATFIKGFGSMVGLNYTFGTSTSKWQSVNENMLFPQVKERVTYHQGEIFVDWQYKFEVAGDTYIILYTGPSIQCQFALSTTVYTRTADDKETELKINSFDYNDADMRQDYKRLNVTWGVGAGFQYDRFYIRGGYDFGLINPYKYNNFADIPEIGYIYGDNHDSGRYTRGRIDQWQIKLGFFFAQFDK